MVTPWIYKYGPPGQKLHYWFLKSCDKEIHVKNTRSSWQLYKTDQNRSWKSPDPGGPNKYTAFTSFYTPPVVCRTYNNIIRILCSHISATVLVEWKQRRPNSYAMSAFLNLSMHVINIKHQHSSLMTSMFLNIMSGAIPPLPPCAKYSLAIVQ
jgi:hypothetical protein